MASKGGEMDRQTNGRLASGGREGRPQAIVVELS